MDRLMRFWLLGLLLALGVGCKSRHSASAGDALSALRMEYAGRIRIDSSEHYILVRVQNPWDTARILHTYVLVGRETELPVGLPEGTLDAGGKSIGIFFGTLRASVRTGGNRSDWWNM